MTASNPSGYRPPSRQPQALRPDRVYLGWQYALLYPHPGPWPRRPSSAAVGAAQSGLGGGSAPRAGTAGPPAQSIVGRCDGAAAAMITLGVLGWFNPSLSGLGALLGLGRGRPRGPPDPAQ